MSRMPRFRRRQVHTSLRSSAVQRSEFCTFLALLPRFALLFFFGRANHSIRGLSTLLKASQQRPAGAVEFDASCYAGMRQPARHVLPPPPSHMPVDRLAMAFIHSVGRAGGSPVLLLELRPRTAKAGFMTAMRISVSE